MKKKLCLSVFLICVLVISPAVAEFSIGDNLDVSLNTHGSTDYNAWDVSATYPLNFINGYAGVEWMSSRESEDKDDNHHYLRARLEGGYQKGIFGLMFYGRYGKRTETFLDSRLHGGSFLHIDIVKKSSVKLNIGMGAWLAEEDKNVKYNEDADFPWGYQAHLNFQFKKFSVYGEFLPVHDLSHYQARVLPKLSIPISKMLFVDQVAFELSGELHYDSLDHPDIKPLQWQWKSGLKFGF